MAGKNAVKVGDRVELVFINDTWTELKPGDKGTIYKIDDGQELIWIDWDNGEQIALLVGIDKFKLLKNNKADLQKFYKNKLNLA